MCLCVSIASFHFFSYKDGNSSHGESVGKLTEAPGQPDADSQTLVLLMLPHLFSFSVPGFIFTWLLLSPGALLLIYLIRNSRHRKLVLK